MAGRIGQMEQMDLPALGQVEGLQVVTQGIDLHVAVGDTLLDLVRHPLTPLQDSLVVVSLDTQNVQTGEAVIQIHCVRSKGKDITIHTALNKEA